MMKKVDAMFSEMKLGYKEVFDNLKKTEELLGKLGLIGDRDANHNHLETQFETLKYSIKELFKEKLLNIIEG